MRFLPLLLLICFVGNLQSQAEQAISDSLKMDFTISLLENIITQEGEVDTAYVYDEIQNFGMISQSKEYLGTDAQNYMEQFVDNLQFSFNPNRYGNKSPTIDIYSLVEGAKIKNADFKVSLFPVETNLVDAFKIVKRSYENASFLYQMNTLLNLKKKIELLNFGFVMPEFKELLFKGYVNIKLEKDIVRNYSVSVDDIGKVIPFDNYQWEVIGFSNNKLQLKTKEKELIETGAIINGSTLESHIDQVIDVNGNAIQSPGRMKVGPIRGALWEAFIENKDNSQVLRKELRKIENQNTDNVKDYLYLVITVDGPLIERLEFNHIEYLNRTEGLDFKCTLEQDGGGSSHDFYKLKRK